MAIPSPQPGSAALVTGASSGIGREFAALLGERGHDIVVAARRKEQLDQLAGELRERWGRRIEVIPGDLSEPAARDGLVQRIRALGLTIDVLVLCAGFGMGGPFTAQDPERVRLMLRTNLEGTVGLAGAFAPEMERRGRGAILIVSSIAGNQPMPNFGAYSATKAAVTSFGETLHEELRPSGVTVTTLCPGGVTTAFAEIAEMKHTERRVPGALMISPADCARAGIEALEQGRRKVVPKPAVRLLHFAGAHTPRAIWLRACRRLMA